MGQEPESNSVSTVLASWSLSQIVNWAAVIEGLPGPGRSSSKLRPGELMHWLLAGGFSHYHMDVSTRLLEHPHNMAADITQEQGVGRPRHSLQGL